MEYGNSNGAASKNENQRPSTSRPDRRPTLSDDGLSSLVGPFRRNGGDMDALLVVVKSQEANARLNVVS